MRLCRVAIAAVVLSAAFGTAVGVSSEQGESAYTSDHTEVSLDASGSIATTEGIHAKDEPAIMRRDQHHHRHHRHHKHHRHGDKLLEVDAKGTTPTTSGSAAAATTPTTTQPSRISCGGHTASICRLCTVIDPKTGVEVEDRGADWCHGDCIYYDGECHTLTGANAHVKRQKSEEGATTSMPVPDLLNPNITDFDRKIMDEAAERSVQEADYEARQKLAEEKKKEEQRKNKMGTFLQVMIWTASGVLSCCAIASCIALYKFSHASAGKNALLSEDAGAYEGEAEAEGEDVAES